MDARKLREEFEEHKTAVDGDRQARAARDLPRDVALLEDIVNNTHQKRLREYREMFKTQTPPCVEIYAGSSWEHFSRTTVPNRSDLAAHKLNSDNFAALCEHFIKRGFEARIISEKERGYRLPSLCISW